MQMEFFEPKSFTRLAKQRVFEGSYGCVYLAKHAQGTFAIKRYKSTPGVYGINNLRELDVLARSQHRFIVKLAGLVVGDPFETASHNRRANIEFDDVSLVLERSERGLDTLAVPLNNSKMIAFEACMALRHLHRLGIIHRDIKRDNILIHHDGEVRLIDFGMAEYHSSSTAPEMRVGIAEMRAPEVLLGNDQYDFSVDIWAMGCVIFEITTGEHLVSSNAKKPEKILQDLLLRFSPEQIVRQSPSLSSYAKNTADPFLDAVTDPLLADLLAGMLHLDHRSRLTIDEVLAHPYFEDLHDLLDEQAPSSLDTTVRPPSDPAVKRAIDAFAAHVYEGRLGDIGEWYTHHILFHFIALAYRLCVVDVSELVFVLYLCVKTLNLSPPLWETFIEDLRAFVGETSEDVSTKIFEFEMDVIRRLDGRLYQHTVVDLATREGKHIAGEVAQRILNAIFTTTTEISPSTLVTLL